MKRILFLFISLAFLSCEKEADVALPSTKPKLVLFAFLSNENAQQTAFVSISSPVIGNYQEPRTITDARVYLISETGERVDFDFVWQVGFYVTPLSAIAIEPGKSYTVYAVLNNDSVWGTTRVPQQAASFSEYVKTKVPSPFEWEQKRRITCKWTDIPGQDNYYRITFYPKPEFPAEDAEELYNGFFLDRQQDGKTMASSFEVNVYNPEPNQSSYALNLVTSDLPYYEYHRRRVNYAGEDPFSEPSPMYNNVKGGLGVVGSYLKTSVELRE
jgi:hypothetical protein